jgi:hypothetical protein
MLGVQALLASQTKPNLQHSAKHLDLSITTTIIKMNYKIDLLKLAIKYTPNKLIIWGSNFVLKGIAELLEFSFDIESRKVYVQTKLYGETEAIEVWLDGFGIIKEDDSYHFIIQQAKSNKPWLNNIIVHFIGKAWKIPVIPQLTPYLPLIAELFKIESK